MIIFQLWKSTPISCVPTAHFAQLNISGSSLVKEALQSGSDLLDKVCQELDKDVKALKGWQNLAHRLCIPPADFKEFDMSKEKKRPTELLFQSLANTKPDLPVDELLEALKTIGRNDVVELFKEHQESKSLHN